MPCSPALIHTAALGPLTDKEPASSLDSHLFQIKGKRKRRLSSSAWMEHKRSFKKKSQDQAPFHVRAVQQIESGLTITQLPQAKTLTRCCPGPLSHAGNDHCGRPRGGDARVPQAGEGPYIPKNLPAFLLLCPQGMGKGVSVLFLEHRPTHVGSAWGHIRKKQAGFLLK